MLKDSLYIGGAMLFIWLLQFPLANQDQMLTVAQMQGRGIQKGIPLTGHMASCWADIALPFLLGYLAYRYGSQWADMPTLVILVISFALSYGLHYTYIQAGLKFPEYVTYGGKLTPAGWIHFTYMAMAFSIIGAFYLLSEHPARSDVILASVWLVLHVIVGVHTIHKIWTPSWFPYHGVWDAGTLAPILGASAVLAGMSWWALR